MQPPVVVESISFCKQSLAEVTGVLFVASVHVHVVLEGADPVEPFAAVVAHVGFLLRGGDV